MTVSMLCQEDTNVKPSERIPAIHEMVKERRS
jgi:hypothetical protein